MKLHDLRPAPGAHKAKRRVGRGIAAGQGKTAGRGTKGQRSRAGGSLPAWFEGGQTPLHRRIPKLRGFRNAFKVEYEIVNLGAIARLAELGGLEAGEHPTQAKRASKAAPAPVTVNQEILRGAGLVRTLDRPLKVLGHGDLSTALFVVADAFSRSARAKIEAAGGSVSVLEVPGRKTRALGVEGKAEPATSTDAAPAATEVPAADVEAPPTDVPETAAGSKPGRAAATKPVRAPRASAAIADEPADAKPAKAALPKAAPPKAARASTARAAETTAVPTKPTRPRKAAAKPAADADTGSA